MAKPETEHRRLASIMFIDMVGYSALVQRNESVALGLLKDYRKIVRSHLDFFEGIEIQTAGDGFLIRFPSALAAVQAAMAIQQSLNARNVEVSRPKQLQARIGLHLGDVVEHEGGDVFGDGVNIAARVEPLAEPGGICLTQQVFDQVQHRLGDQIVPLGAVALKNISPAPNLFRIPAPGTSVQSARPNSRFPKWLRTPRVIRWAMAATLALAILFGARESQRKGWWQRKMPAQRQVVILPFEVIGTNTENVAFCDGLVETLATKLTQMQGARQSCFVIPPGEAREARIRTAGDAVRFGATLVLRGQIQRQGEVIRVTVNLMETATRRQLRSEVLDTPFRDLYELEDRIAYKVGDWLGLKQPTLAENHSPNGPVINGKLYEYYLMGMGQLARWDREEILDMAPGNFALASSDPGFALPVAGQAEAYFLKFRLTHRSEFLDMAQTFCSRALTMDSNLVPALVTQSAIHSERKQLDPAIEELRRALVIEPGNYQAWLKLARATEGKNRLDEAQQLFKKAISLGSLYWGSYNEFAAFQVRRGNYGEALKLYHKALELTPDNPVVYRNIGGIYFYLGQTEKAIQACRKSIEASPTPEAYSNLATIYFFQKQYTNAAAMFEKAIEGKPPTAVLLGNLADAYRYINRPADAKRYYLRAISAAEKELKTIPGNDDLRSSLALYYASVPDKESAIREIQIALAKGTNDANVVFKSALVHELIGERAAALRALGQALRNQYSTNEIQEHPDLARLREDSEYKLLSAGSPQTKQ